MSQVAELNREELANKHVVAQGKTFVWHQIFGPSDDASLNFYTKSLDWGTTEFPMGNGMTYKMLTVDGIAVAGAVSTLACPNAHDVPPHWSVSIGVDDVDARLAKCVANGATVLQPAFDIPTVGRMAFIQDPQGAAFWLFKGEGC